MTHTMPTIADTFDSQSLALMARCAELLAALQRVADQAHDAPDGDNTEAP